jgi:hypothetical protein
MISLDRQCLMDNESAAKVVPAVFRRKSMVARHLAAAADNAWLANP